MEINFNVSRASGDQNNDLPPPNGFDQAVPISGINHVGNPVPFTYHLLGLLPNHIEAYRQVFLEGQAPDNPKGICGTSFWHFRKD